MNAREALKNGTLEGIIYRAIKKASKTSTSVSLGNDEKADYRFSHYPEEEIIIIPDLVQKLRRDGYQVTYETSPIFYIKIDWSQPFCEDPEIE